ncbi:peptide ABC transporter substrate-binding protein [Acidithiobacillus sp. CV18-2]|uniref:Peptide ABC transporter substrate-binding protein n=2 Tax=Igneacidithiobacillus copahuensis TaxID=2724909 RepID=A0AAE2YMD4_9PROT|nr:peptide ABC transporter substrate-binding protein [Acidithiobacillus sp. CV18-3]MBU2755844.1 peptide ABC transporter substrate-binding protein [Acidithiobacillus sp. BN09-2]MBU2776562.1 peptide ABC transporter substrate-binding protein [Acidithiobacillus sp. CV18-2]MBU2786749.1 peptide ABC transporter substrate-binding protein [Igneacidithiobacillus copahuensis]MBU2797738.1 peptide ABC transporter substrate-binding protein [Acidithiobacillus sp. VAN18-2]MBU2798584.1 peptide ABC transporter 
MNVNSLLPVVNNDSSANAQIISLMFRPLLWIGTNLTIDWKESIAKSVSVSANRRTFTIYLKNWKWSDGRTVTANDTLACLHLIRKAGVRYPNAGMGGMPNIVESAKVVNQRTLIITLKRPVNPTWFELNGLSQLFPIPSWRWKAYSTNDLYRLQDNPAMVTVVDGPYKLQRFTLGRNISFVRNPEYSGSRPPLRTLSFTMVTSDANAFWALKSGKLQVGMIPHYLYAARGMVNNLRTCVSNGGYGFNYIALNFTNPSVAFLRNVRVRQALSLAINQEQIIQVAFHGLGVPGFNPVPTNPDTYLSPEMKHLVAYPDLAFQPEKAKELLREAGWRTGKGGIRFKDGHRLGFTMMVPDTSQTLVAVAELLQSDWEKIGVDLRLRMMPFNLELAKMHPKGKWDSSMIVWSYNPDYYPSGDGIFNTNGGTNYGGYSNSLMDQLIRDSTEKNGLNFLYQYENYAYEQQPVIFLPYPEYIVKYSQDLSHEQVREALYSVDCVPGNK